MKHGWILAGLTVALMVSACGAEEAAPAAGDAAADAAQAPVFTEATLETLRQAPGAAIRETLQYAGEECSRGAALGFEPGAITTADLNGDGSADYLVDMSRMTCGGEPAGNGWCGSGGCSFEVFVSTGNDFHQDSYLGMEPEIVRRGEGLAISVVGRDGPWMIAWGGSSMEIVERMDGAPVQAGAAGEDEPAVRAVVASIYDAYADGFDSGSRVPEGVETAEFRRVIDAAIDPEMGGLGFDFYCACQDYGDVSYDMSGVALNGDRATVAVDFRSYGALTQLELRLRKVGGRWQVDDVIDPNGSVRRQLGEG